MIAKMILRAETRFAKPTRLGRLFSSCQGKQFPSSPYDQLGPERTNHDLQEVIKAARGASTVLTEQRKERREATSLLEKQIRAEALEKYQRRIWKVGDVYAPHDLCQDAFNKDLRPRIMKDSFDRLGINPLDEYKNFSIMWEYTSQTGRIRHRNETNLRGVNQRRIAKAVRRAVGMGLMPSVHQHPEVLEEMRQLLARQRHEQAQAHYARGPRDSYPPRR